jgi:hypothetical protein
VQEEHSLAATIRTFKAKGHFEPVFLLFHSVYRRGRSFRFLR